MANRNNKRLSVKLNLSNSERLSRLARNSAMNIGVPALVNAAIDHSMDWLNANTPRKYGAK